MEEQALYRAILAAPHDDAVRLAYADWLDENADVLPHPAAERGRAELIRLQCERARLVPSGWRVGPPQPPEERERRLLFRYGRAWRRAFRSGVSSAPFDRGFLRPFRSFTPHRVLYAPTADTDSPFLPLPLRSPARRYVPEDDGLFAVAPLWDIHLYAPGWLNDPLADSGQYGPLLADVAESPGLRQVGWLKLSFLRTPVVDFLRAGRFDNVETLVLNSGPFPDVLHAVAGNESFRSLRYVQFGSDLWAWAPTYPERIRFYTLQSQLAVLNDKHLPFGAMRDGVRSVLQNTPLTLPPMVPAVDLNALLASPTFAAGAERRDNAFGRIAGPLLVLVLSLVYAGTRTATPPQPVKLPGYQLHEFKMPDLKPLELPKYPLFPTGDPLKLENHETVDEMLRKWQEVNPNAPLGGRPWSKRLPTAPPPRAVEREVAPPPRAVEE